MTKDPSRVTTVTEPPAPDADKVPEAKRSLTQRFVSMSMWNILQVISQMGLRLVSNLALTRLLLPEAFGLMAFAMTIQTAAMMMSDIGVERSIIRDKEGDQTHFLQAAWTVRLVRSGIVSGVMIIIALIILPLIAPLFDPSSVLASPEAPGITAIISLVPIMRALGSANEVTAHRNLQVRRVFTLDLSVQLLGIIMLVACTFIWPTAWTLAIGTVVITGIKAAATHVFLPGPRMALMWDRPVAARLWDYGKWLIGSSIFGFVARHSEKLIIAGAVDATLFGLYSIARLWAEASQKVLEHVLNSAGMAALSEILRTPGRDPSGPFGRIQTGVDAMIVVGSVAFFFCIGPFIEFIYPPAFDGAAQFAPLFCLLFLRLRFSTFDSLLLSSGQTRTLMNTSIQVAIAVAVMVPLAMTYFGLEATIIAFCLAQLVSVPSLLLASRKNLPQRNFTIDWAWFALSIALGLLAMWAV